MFKRLLIIGCGIVSGLAMVLMAADPVTVSEDSLTVGANPSDSAGVLLYTDGIFRGSSTEWTGMTVEVRIESGKIRQVNVIEVNGTPEFYEIVLKELPRLIEKSGSPDVDSITGATLSSESLKKAIQKALVKARKS